MTRSKLKWDVRTSLLCLGFFALIGYILCWQGNDRKADRSPNGRLEHQHADHLHGPNGIADGSSFLGSHHARIAKSKSALDLPAKPNGYNSETNSSYHEGPHIESDSWNRDRSRRQGSDSRQQNLPAHGLMLLEHTHLNHSRVHRDRSAAPLTWVPSLFLKTSRTQKDFPFGMQPATVIYSFRNLLCGCLLFLVATFCIVI